MLDAYWITSIIGIISLIIVSYICFKASKNMDANLELIDNVKHFIEATPSSSQLFYKKGERWFFRLATNYIIGEIEDISSTEILLKPGTAAWVACTGRFYNFLNVGVDQKGVEIEPYGDVPVIIGRGAIVDGCAWKHELPLEQK